MTNFSDLAGFGAYMLQLWTMLPTIIQNLIYAVASLAIVIGLVQLFD